MKKKVLCMLVAAMMATSLTACGGAAADDKTATDGADKGATASADGGADKGTAANSLRVAWIGDGNNRDNLLRCFEPYETENNTSIDLTFIPGNWGEYFTKIQTMVAGGEALDCIFGAIEGFEMMVDLGLALPLTDYAKANEEKVNELFTDVPKGLGDTFYINNELYGFPQGYNSMVTHFNTAVFEELGVPVPKEGWTSQEWLEASEKLTREEDGVKKYSTFIPVSYFELESLMRNNGGTFMNEDLTKATINSPECIEVFQFLQDLIHKYGYAPIPEPNMNSDQMLIDGTVAIKFAGRWAMPTYEENEFTTVAIQNIPVFSENVLQFGIDGMFVCSATKQPDAAADFAYWTSEPDFIRDFLTIGSIPSRLSLAEELVPKPGYPENNELFYKHADTAVPISSPKNFAECSTIVVDAASQILVEKADVQAVLNDANAKIDQALAKK